MIEKIKNVWYFLGVLLFIVGASAYDGSPKQASIMCIIGCIILYTATLFEEEKE